MNRVYKYRLAITDEQEVRLPHGARILTVQEQRGHLSLWAQVDPEQMTNDIRTIRVIGTGHPIADSADLTYIATVQTADGALVWHVYEGPTK